MNATKGGEPRAPRAPIIALWAILLAATLGPLALLGVIASHSRQQALEGAAETATRTALTLHEHARNVFDSFALAMDRIEVELPRRSWEEIAGSQALHDLLSRLAAERAQIGSIWLVDADGTARASSARFPQPAMDVSDRDYFRPLVAGHAGIYVGETITTRMRGRTAFTVARALRTPEGDFAGAIVITAYPAYFAEFYRRIAPDLDHSAGLVRADGVFLVRDAVAVPSTEQPTASPSFFRMTAEADEGHWTGVSLNDGIRRFVAYKKLESYPVYVLFAVGTDSALAPWRREMGSYALVAGAAAAGLLAVGGFALVRTRREQLAALRLARESRAREALEAQLRHAGQLDALGKLTGGIAHDFNNILTVVLANLELLRRAPEEKRRRYVDNALAAVEQGRRINAQLLSFGRRQPLRPEPLDVNVLIAGMDDILTQSLRGDIRLALDLGADLPLVKADASQLKVALVNIAVNARDAMPDGGVLTVTTRRSPLLNAPVDGVAITVADTGEGMSEEVRERAFEPFFTTKATGRGTGLGLPQVYGFAEQSGGEASIDAAPGAGTRVTIRLPATDEAPRSADGSDEGAQAPAIGKLRILLVEDNATLAETAAAILTDAGHEVVRVPTADAAAHEATSGFDLVVSDIVMPGAMSGFDLAQRLRESRPDLPILLSTGYSQAIEQVRESAFPLLPKPYSPDQLRAAVAHAAAAGRGGEPRAALTPAASPPSS
jgi:two-component system NtrC family sensor kinase